VAGALRWMRGLALAAALAAPSPAAALDDPVRWELRAGGNGTIMAADGRVIAIGCPRCAQSFGTGLSGPE
jgi:hypothetical protein